MMDENSLNEDFDAPDSNLSENDGIDWVAKARQAFNASNDYIDTNHRPQWSTNIKNFKGKLGAKENDKIFRPKIRSALRSHEAALASALFTNNNVVDIVPTNDDSEIQKASADLNRELLQYRLTTTIPWFQTVIGAFQDTSIYERVVSKTYWEYETKELTEQQFTQDEEGNYSYDEEGYAQYEDVSIGAQVLKDEPSLDLIAPENFHYDPNSDWRNPIKDSPFLIEVMPMYVGDILSRMGVEDEKLGVPAWYEYTQEKIIANSGNDKEYLRQERQGNGQDPVDIATSQDNQIVFVHFNIIKEDGIDMAFYTVGTNLILSEPVPLDNYYILGRETYTIGYSGIETHNANPQSLSELGENLQKEINTVANQRLENVKLVLNKRYFIKENSKIDLAALMRNVAGGGVMTSDPINDVRVIDTPDVTGSSYAEQDRLNMDADEILGSFSQSTIAANRTLNETVGGMNLIANASNTTQEYIMRIFIETWVEPTLRKLVRLEQHYETDQTILAVAGAKAGIKDEMIKFAGNPEVLDQLIQQDVLVTCSVGMGNTSPDAKIKKLMLAINTTAAMPEVAERTDWAAVTAEIYSYAGFNNGERFIKKDDGKPKEQQIPPEVQLAQHKQAHEMKMLESKQSFDLEIAKVKAQTDIQKEQMNSQARAETDIIESNNRRELELIKLSEAKGLKLEDLRVKLDIASSADKTKREIEALKASMFNREINTRYETGSGIQRMNSITPVDLTPIFKDEAEEALFNSASRGITIDKFLMSKEGQEYLAGIQSDVNDIAQQLLTARTEDVLALQMEAKALTRLISPLLNVVAAGKMAESQLEAANG